MIIKFFLALYKIIKILVSFILILLLVAAVQCITTGQEGSVAFCIALLLLLCFLWKIDRKFNNAFNQPNIEQERQYQQSLYQKEQEKIIQEKQLYIENISKYASVLVRKYKQLVYIDDYGFKKTGKFKSELEYFIKNVLYRNKQEYEYNLSYEIVKLLDYIETDLLPHNKSIDISDNPYEFEQQCAEILNNNGWQAKATQKSSDQGIDVIAAKKNITVAIQCKLYSKPVGNKAVQEAFSGKEFYQADYAAVVSNNTYTASAKTLANNCGVLLLSPDDLPNLENILH